jgi:HK97 family phage major capsid protein
MPSMTVDQLRRRFRDAHNRRQLDELRHQVAGEIRQVADATEEDGSLSTEAQQLFDALKQLLGELDQRISRQAVIDDLDTRSARPRDRADRGFDSILPEFSLRGMIASAIGSPIPGLDIGRSVEISQELRARAPRQFLGFAAPLQSLYLRADYARHLNLERRADTISTGLPAGGPGGSLIPLDLDAGRYVDALRARTVVIAAGAQTITDLVGNLDIPRMSKTAQVAWFNEGDDIIDSDEEFDRVSFRPKHCGAIVTYSRNMLLQSTPAIEMLIRDDLSRLLALDMDRVALTGSGQGAEPLGVVRNPAVIPTPAAAFSYLQNVAMRQQISGKNVPLESLAWIGNSQIDSWSLSVLDTMHRPLGKQLVYLGIPDYTSNIVTAPAVTGPPALPALVNPLILGAFSDMYLTYWSALDILPNALADSAYRKGAVMVRALMTADVNVRHPESFTYSAISGAPVIPAAAAAEPPPPQPEARRRAA